MVTPKKTVTRKAGRPAKPEAKKDIPELKTDKVKDVTIKPTAKIPPVEERPRITNSRDFDVVINGRQRSITRSTYMALLRDPERYTIELAKDSPLRLIDADGKPCKDC